MPRIPQPGANLDEMPDIRGMSRFFHLADAYHFLLSGSWTYVLGVMVAGFVGINLVFTALYRLGGDCIVNARPGSWLDAFFFSVQTFASVGYGVLAPGTDYASGVAAAEAGVGLLAAAMATGIMFAKFARPTARVLFSQSAVVHDRNGVPHLAFRMANARRNLVVQARLHVVILMDEVTQEGHKMRRLRDLRLVRSESPMFALSWIAMHEINEESPLYGMTPEAFAASGATVIVSVTGVDDTFAATIQARYRYRTEDVRWGQNFVDILQIGDDERYVDLTRLSHTIDAPCSPAVLPASEAATAE